MTRLWPQGEPIQAEVDDEGRLRGFVWQGRRHTVETVHQRWQVDSDWWEPAGRVWREYLAVTTAGGLLCVLYRDCLDWRWYLARLYD